VVALAAEEHDARRRDRGFPFDNTTRFSLAGRLGMTFHHVNAFNEKTILLRMTITVSFFLIFILYLP
jgi:hypothetical protein